MKDNRTNNAKRTADNVPTAINANLYPDIFAARKAYKESESWARTAADCPETCRDFDGLPMRSFFEGAFGEWLFRPAM